VTILINQPGRGLYLPAAISLHQTKRSPTIFQVRLFRNGTTHDIRVYNVLTFTTVP